jgi:hypothetical protein
MSKASKRRPCLALGREISPADCGEQRQSRLACPEDCTYNPFAPANYSELLEIEDRLDRKTMERFMALNSDPTSLQRELDRAERRSLHAVHALFAWYLFFADDGDGMTFAERWERAGFKDLKNDERVLMRSKAQMHVALLEIHRVSASGLMDAVDLLSAEPATLILQDRSLAGVAVRFTTLLAWIYPVPHYWRLSGSAVTIVDMAQFTALEIVHEIVGHLGSPSIEREMRRWLAEHFVEFSDALESTAHLRRRQMLARVDARVGRAVYEIRALFAQCRKLLDKIPDVSPDDLTEAEREEGFVEARVWFDHASDTKHMALPGGQMVLGRILLGQSRWRLEAFGAEKLSRLRRQFEEHLGERVRFSAERIDDLGVQLSAGEPAVDESLVPPRLLENPQQLVFHSSRGPALPPDVAPEDVENEILRAAEQAFLDDSIPALDNHTPRQAAADPALRAKLVHLIKQRVRLHDQRNLKSGRIDDINWLLRELDLKEIDFDAPPWRPPPADLSDDDEGLIEQEDSDAISVHDSLRLPPPPLPDEPFDFEQAIQRLQDGLDAFETAGEAENELDASGATILDDAEHLTIDDLTDDEFLFAIPFLVQIWFALVPPGCRAPEISLADLERAYVSNMGKIESGAKARTAKELEFFFQEGSQPAMMMALLGGFLEAANKAPKTLRPSAFGQSVILALLASLLETLDNVLRPR